MQSTVDTLLKALAPFNEVEKVAGLLGIPVDARGNPTVMQSHSLNIDPRSQEFREVLNRLSKAIAFLRQHPEFRDSDKYLQWLEQLQHRATSLIAKTMKDLLENAGHNCLSKIKKSSSSNSTDRLAQQHEETPFESSPIYTKFRNLGFRMRELSSLLLLEVDGGTDVIVTDENPAVGYTALEDVKRAYVLLRSELLQHVVRNSIHTSGVTSGLLDSNQNISTLENVHYKGVTDGNKAEEGQWLNSNLCLCIRSAYSILLRLIQLEYQLFETIFAISPLNTSNSNNNMDSLASTNNKESSSSSSIITTNVSKTLKDTQTLLSTSLHTLSLECPEEVLSIADILCGETGDILRPLIIRSSDVDDLCRVITTLAEDVRSQIMAIKIPHILLVRLLGSLNRTVTDAQERLAYCSEGLLRLEVQLFEPLHSQLAYPDILERASNSHQNSTKIAGKSSLSTRNEVTPSHTVASASTVEDVARTWYPPLKSTLSLLSKLYGVVDRVVFEDFARRSVQLCVESLRHGADGVRRIRSPLHGDLFLVRHLLILREQLIPFELNMQTIERRLDFSSTGNALSKLIQHSRSMLRFDRDNAFIQMAMDGIPELKEKQIDTRRDLDFILKQSCSNLKLSILRNLIGPIDAFITKVTAFIGEIPLAAPSSNDSSSSHSNTSMSSMTSATNSNTDLTIKLDEHIVTNLKAQAFIRPDRVLELLRGEALRVAENAPELRHTMQVQPHLIYIFFILSIFLH